MDASNAFNIKHTFPSIATILINTYREPAELYIDVFPERVQPPCYAHVCSCYNSANEKAHLHCPPADDAACAGKLSHLRKWWDDIDDISASGPGYGHFANAPYHKV